MSNRRWLSDYANATPDNGTTTEEGGTVFQSYWISVKDRLPDEEGMYLCVFDDRTIETFEFEGRDLDFWGVRARNAMLKPCRVTHWMPLPEPPDDEG